MMGIIGTILKKTFFWNYDRGSWQYDVLCGLILAFIFFGPNYIFHSADGANSAPTFIKREDVGDIAPENLEKVISEHISKKFNRKVVASQIELMRDETGNIKGYLVKEIKQ
ncbi:MAG: hypothetical protein AB1757_14850 [Acidobacteriota bacterium]